MSNEGEAQRHFEAASSKCECAKEVFFPALLDALGNESKQSRRTSSGIGEPAPVRVRAFFDALLWSSNAAREQFKEALAEILGVEPHGSAVVTELQSSDPQAARDLQDWWSQPIVQDAKEIRDSAAHHYYTKSPTPSSGWTVDPPAGGSTYDGSREISAYAASLLEATQRLEEIMNRVWGSLSA